MNLWGRRRCLMASNEAPFATVAGSIARFIAKKVTPIKELKVAIEPVQEGSGDPYPPGGGKNKWSEGNQVIDAYKLVPITVPAGNWTFSALVESTTVLNHAILFKENADGTGATVGSTTIGNGTGRISNSFGLSAEAKSIALYAATAWNESQGQTTTYTDIQLESGTTQTPYAPYSNIRPITGWTGCEVWKAGVNLLGALEDGYFPLFLPKGTTIVASCDNLDSTNRVTYYNKNKTQVDYWNLNFRSHETTRQNRSFTLTADAYYFAFTHNDWNCQVEFGNTDSDYVAPSGTTASVTFPDTVYGGSHEFVSGGLVKRLINNNINMASGKIENANGYYWYSTATALGFSAIKSTNEGLISDRLIKNPNLNEGSNEGDITFYANGIIRWKEHGDLSLADYNDYLAQNPIQIVYEVAEPTEISLTPQPISTLKDENNVWANAGDVTVTAAGIQEITPSSAQALNMLLGGMYTNNHTADDVSDDEALDIILGGSNA